MAKARQPGDLFRAFQGKKQKLAPALTAPHNPGAMPGFRRPVKPEQRNMDLHAPENYGPAMRRATQNTKVFGAIPAAYRKSSKRKKASSTTIAPTNRGRKAQQAYANKFGTVPVLRNKKRKASKVEIEMALKKKGSCKCKSACKHSVKKKSASR